MVTMDGTTQVYSNSQVNLSCVVKIAEEVDTPITVRTQWNTPSPTFGNSRITMRDENISPLVFRSILSIDSVVVSDTGLYTCITNVEPRNSRSSVSGVFQTMKEFILTLCKCHYACS